MQEELYAAFIGDKSSKMLSKTLNHYWFNVFAFLFGCFYYAYRKLYVEAAVFFFILFVLNLASALMLAAPGTIFFSVVTGLVGLVQAILFYTLYDKKIQRTIKAANNDEDPWTRRQYMAKAGGTSLAGIIVVAIVTVLCGFCITGVGNYTKSINKNYVSSQIAESLTYHEGLLSTMESTDVLSQDAGMQLHIKERLEAEHEGVEDLKQLEQEIASTDASDKEAIRNISNRLAAIESYLR